MINHYDQQTAFTTKDGSTIRELMHPDRHNSQNQSLAEAIVGIGEQTQLHRHHTSEELYHITHGEGLMTLGEKKFEVVPGDTVCIPPGAPHKIENHGKVELHILCSCAPPYRHDDTELIG